MISFSKKLKRPGSSMITINVDFNGKPFGQLWTFKERDCTSCWFAKVLKTDETESFPRVSEAKAWIERCSMK